MTPTWPRHGSETVAWRSSGRRGSREDRMLREITASIPPMIAELDYVVPPAIVPEMERAVQAIAALESGAGPGSAAITSFLVRIEAIASSKIESVEATSEDFARALAGSKANESAALMVAASRAVTRMINVAGESGRITLDAILAAHKDLLSDDPNDGPHAGSLRSVQNWIGGSDYSPLRAAFVPPTPERVPALMDDLIRFSNRDDIPVIAQATIAHAQFESIHPFVDGNGRVGRALIGAIIRRRGFNRTTIPPIASALVAEQETYFGLIGRYRVGEPDEFVRAMAVAASISSEEALASVTHIRELPTEWAAQVRPRAGSAADSLLNRLLDHPVLSAEEAEGMIAAATSSTYAALDRLEAAGIIHSITNRSRNRVWAVSAIVDELDDLNARISERVRTRT